MRIYALLYLIVISCRCIAIDIDDIALTGCTNYSNCGEATSAGLDASNLSGNESSPTVNLSGTKIDDGRSTTETTKESDKTTTISQNPVETTSTTTVPAIGETPKNDVDEKTSFIPKNHSYICTCDKTISSCDINCCCDIDCNDFQLSVFSHCKNHRPKMYDSRYCYTQNFIQRNNTQFILERLASNLFCIAYDNLPPIYGMSDVPDVTNRKAFDDAKRVAASSEYTWDWRNTAAPSEFNFSGRYHDADVLWKFQANYVNKIELPQSGFTARCTFRKTLKYLETFSSMCMQTKLSNDNPYLFSDVYENFTVIASPHLFNSSHGTKDHICPSNVCIPVQSLYCSESWSRCNDKKPAEHSCTSGNCRNVVKRVHYTVVHNGTNGIERIEARFELIDTRRQFYQYFEVVYRWAGDNRMNDIFSPTGNHGYTIGDPIIIGGIVTNVANNVNTKHIEIDRTSLYMTTPVRRKDGHCDPKTRHVIGFGEDARLTCNIQLRTNNFSSEACVKLQNRTFELFLEDRLRNLTEIVGYKTFVSKLGDITANETSNWTQILLDRIPQNVVTGQIHGDRIRCSGLITSLKYEILHTILTKPEDSDNNKIAGVAATFSEPVDLFWPKCHGINCTDILKMEISTSAMYIDISTPSMYYYADGPNLDISLPYDFFYPFMSNSGSEAVGTPVGSFTILTTLIIIYFTNDT